ncbi:cytochrome P450 [Amycolatopsis sp. NPDC021455]|uniref:cytochrome P450 n=1 Tax=Amycolatopsis sp. NPDC021455 TaxID=3154901 RepID=UPI0033FD993D
MTDLLERAPAILGFDPFDPEYRRDPYPVYHALRTAGPVQRTEGGLVLALSHDVCSAVFRDPRFGHQSGVANPIPFRAPASTAAATGGGTRWFVVLDPPDHTRLRRLVSRGFTPALIEEMIGAVTRLSEELLDDMLDAGGGDLLADWAYPLSLTVISEILGVPHSDRGLLKHWSAVIGRGIDPDFVMPPAERELRGQVWREFSAYFTDLAARRRADPGTDVLSKLAIAEEDGDALTMDELVATCTLILMAGHETVVDLFGGGTLALLADPEQRRLLAARPELAGSAVDELLRFDPPVQMVARTALTDLEIGGVPMRRGEMIMAVIGAANRDPAVYDRPDRLDLTRQGPRHLAFGLGIHYCLGAPLGRMQGRVGFRTLLAKARSLRLDTDRLTYRDNLMSRGLAALPVRIER